MATAKVVIHKMHLAHHEHYFSRFEASMFVYNYYLMPHQIHLQHAFRKIDFRDFISYVPLFCHQANVELIVM